MATIRRIDKAVEHEIRRLSVFEELPPSQILRRLKSSTAFNQSKLPDVRTVQRIIKDIGPSDTSDVWNVRDGDDVDVRQILRVLHEVTKRSEGRKNTFTKNEAKWIGRVVRALPKEYSEGPNTFNLVGIHLLAREYMVREEHKGSTADLEHFLAYWGQGQQLHHFDDYWQDVDKGWIAPPRGVLFTLAAELRESEYRQENRASQSRSDDARKSLSKEGKEWMDRRDKEIEKMEEGSENERAS